MVVMPNAPKTPQHSVRAPDDLWRAARVKAEGEGSNLSEVIRKFLTVYTTGEGDRKGGGGATP